MFTNQKRMRWSFQNNKPYLLTMVVVLLDDIPCSDADSVFLGTLSNPTFKAMPFSQSRYTQIGNRYRRDGRVEVCKGGPPSKSQPNEYTISHGKQHVNDADTCDTGQQWDKTFAYSLSTMDRNFDDGFDDVLAQNWW